jgi:hypothetical protein
MQMKLIKVRRMGCERVLAVPKTLAEKLQAPYMAINMDEYGRLIYTPISEVS